MHFGSEYVKNYVQQNFYVFGLRDALHSITYRCFDCRQFKGQRLQPPMADLPDIRFPQDQSPVVFTNVGIDYIGPFTVIQRGKEEKICICLINCLVTRAVHLEATEDLTTNATLEVNDVVWVLEEWTPRGIWPLGRVTRTFTGPDRTARSFEVKTALGFLTRPAVKLAHVFQKTPPAG